MSSLRHMYPHVLIRKDADGTITVIGPFITLGDAKKYCQDRQIQSRGATFEYQEISKPFEWSYHPQGASNDTKRAI